MLVYYMVHVESNPGQAQLLAGDVVQLERLLPESQVVALLQPNRDQNRPTRLTTEEAVTLKEELCGLDQGSLEVRYYRSTASPEFITTQKDLVEGFIGFLDDELRHLAGT